MAPDASKLRRRLAHEEDGPTEAINDDALDTNARSLKTLQGHEVAIDGIVYDLRSFNHPGGDSIFVFGGNDASIQYRMIHPFHTGNKHLEKLKKVGTIPDYTCE